MRTSATGSGRGLEADEAALSSVGGPRAIERLLGALAGAIGSSRLTARVPIAFVAGETVVCQGDPADGMYLVARGSVEVALAKAGASPIAPLGLKPVPA